ncbi:DNA-binding protein (plasmid) [Bacillus mycoides]|uniref:helix-turn-helix domain-containing protein n=1 Tax=Bacillus mycoides TaxID=1405 RepID=UPI001C00C17A|nr:helix-turn-helix domain-containing protein [Bacillus mycoides]QWG42933.1 DNA-binding protein [Bacillus mycoides]
MRDMSLTYYEKTQVQAHVKSLATHFNSHDLSGVLAKVFGKVIVHSLESGTMKEKENYLKQLTYLNGLSEKQLANKDQMNEVWENILNLYTETATLTEEFEDGVYYTPKELSKFFGVSHQTINNWISGGRFKRFFKEKGKHVRINENAIWISRSGENILVKDIVKEYQERCPELSINEQLEEINREIVLLEEKYGDSFYNIFGNKINNLEKLSIREKMDAEAWQYLIQMKLDIE